jgi:hypothetical protein
LLRRFEELEINKFRFGEYGYNYGLNETIYMPEPGDQYDPSGSMIFINYNASTLEFIFIDSPQGGTLNQLSMYSARKIALTYNCSSYKVVGYGNGTSYSIEVEQIGNVSLAQTSRESSQPPSNFISSLDISIDA